MLLAGFYRKIPLPLSSYRSQGTGPMYRIGLPCVLSTLAFAVALPAQDADKAATLKQALALQEVMQQAIEQAEPSIACILVSRSDAYQRFSQGPSAESIGKLGP